MIDLVNLSIEEKVARSRRHLPTDEGDQIPLSIFTLEGKLISDFTRKLPSLKMNPNILLVGSSDYYLKKRKDWYVSELNKLFPNSTGVYNFYTINPISIITEHSLDFIARHFFLEFGADPFKTKEKEAIWFRQYQHFFDVIVYETTPHCMNQKKGMMKYVCTLLNNHGFFIYLVGQKYFTSKLMVQEAKKTLGDLGTIYSLTRYKNKDVWQKRLDIQVLPHQVIKNKKKPPNFEEASKLSTKELTELHAKYHYDKQYSYLWSIYRYKMARRTMRKEHKKHELAKKIIR